MNSITIKFGMVEIYALGALLMVATTAGNIVTVVQQMNMGILMPSQTFSSIMGLFFNALWVYFFYFLWRLELIKEKKEKEALKQNG